MIARAIKMFYKCLNRIVNRPHIQFGCIDSGEETPDPIPNSEVKLTCGDGSARETWCQISKMHPSNLKKATRKSGFFLPRN